MLACLPFIFHKRLFGWLTLSFIVATIIGTISHECGHYLAARYFGFAAHIHYKFTNWQARGPLYDSIRHIYQRDSTAIINKQPFPEEWQYRHMQQRLYQKMIIIGAAGPTETMLTGTIGLLLLIVFRKAYRGITALKVWQWLLVFATLFWLRQLFDLTIMLATYLVKHRLGMGDETALSYALHWPPATGYLLTGGIAAIVLFIVTSRFIPLQQRYTFLLAGLAGGATGAVLWLVLLGPVVMP